MSKPIPTAANLTVYLSRDHKLEVVYDMIGHLEVFIYRMVDQFIEQTCAIVISHDMLWNMKINF